MPVNVCYFPAQQALSHVSCLSAQQQAILILVCCRTASLEIDKGLLVALTCKGLGVLLNRAAIVVL